VTVVAGGGFAATVAGASSEGGAAAAPPSPPAGAIAPAASIPAQAASQFAALRTAASARPLPSGLNPGASPGAAAFGINAALARYIVSADPGGLWVVPGTTGMCLAEGRAPTDPPGFVGSTSCTTTADAAAGWLGLTHPANGSQAQSAVGLVPDLLTGAVELRESGGASRAVAAADGAFYVSGPTAASITIGTATWTIGASGGLGKPPGQPGS
jgi:hypothetical protein